MAVTLWLAGSYTLVCSEVEDEVEDGECTETPPLSLQLYQSEILRNIEEIEKEVEQSLNEAHVESPGSDGTASSSLLGRVDDMLAPSESDGNELSSGYGTDDTRPYSGSANTSQYGGNYDSCPYHGNYDSDGSASNWQTLCPPPLYNDWDFVFNNSNCLTQYDSDDN